VDLWVCISIPEEGKSFFRNAVCLVGWDSGKSTEGSLRSECTDLDEHRDRWWGVCERGNELSDSKNMASFWLDEN
jgi:hypothetical protein